VTVKLLNMVTHTCAVVSVPGAGFAERPVRPWNLLVARLGASWLDRRLASGEPPEASLELAVRAQWLTRPRARRELARTLRRLLAHAEANPSLISAIPLHRRQVRAAAVELAALADRVERGGPVSAFGVVQLRSLISDGGGPLYGHARPDELSNRVRAVRAALDVLGPNR
jgi:hypothetical protein